MFEVINVHQRQGGVDVRKRIVQIIVTVALTLGLLAGTGLVDKVTPFEQVAKMLTPTALMGGGSNA